VNYRQCIVELDGYARQCAAWLDEQPDVSDVGELLIGNPLDVLDRAQELAATYDMHQLDAYRAAQRMMDGQTSATAFDMGLLFSGLIARHRAQPEQPPLMDPIPPPPDPTRPW